MTHPAVPGDARRSAATSAGRTTRHGAVYTAASVVQGFAVVLALRFILATLDAVEYGHVAVGLSIVQIGVILAGAGLPLAITRAHFDEDRGPERATALMGLLALAAVASAATATALSPLWAPYVAGGAVTGMLLASVWAVAATAVVAGGQAIMRAAGRPGAFAAAAIGSTVGAHVVGLTFAQVRPTATAYMSGYLVGATLTALVTVGAVRPSVPWRTPGALRDARTVGLPVLPHSLALLVMTNVDPILLERLLSPVEAGRYHAAMVLGLAPLSLISGINNAWAPAILGATDRERWPRLAATTTGVLALSAVFTVGTALVAPIAVRLLAAGQPDPAELTRLVQILSLTCLGQVVYLATSIVLFARKRTGWLAVITPACAAVMVTVASVLVPTQGLPAMAGAKVLAFALLAGACWVVAGRLAPVPWPYVRAGLLVAVAVAAVVLVSAVPQTPRAMTVQLACAVALGALVVVAVARVARPDRGRPAGSTRA